MTTPESHAPGQRLLVDVPLIVEDLLLRAESRLADGDRREARELLTLALRIGSGEA